MTRYAIYYAPDPHGAFWARASAWLGRDAASGADVAQAQVAGLSAEEMAAITADPRHYGFHATIKAPFALAERRDEAGLVEAMRTFAAGRAPFETPLTPAPLGRFLAFRPDAPCPHIQSLHEDSVRAFEMFRSPLSEAELERRRKADLTGEQDRLLVLWGYPYVFGHFRFHMTLTGSIADDSLRHMVLQDALRHFAPDCGPHRFARISLFRQDRRDSPFTIIGSFPFGQQ